MEKFSRFRIKGISFFALPILFLSLFLLIGKNVLDDYTERKMADGYRLAVQHSVERGSEFRRLQLQMKYSKLLASKSERRQQINNDISEYIVAATKIRRNNNNSAEDFLAD